MSNIYTTFFRLITSIAIVFGNAGAVRGSSITITQADDISIASPNAVQQSVKAPNNGAATTFTVASFKC